MKKPENMSKKVWEIEKISHAFLSSNEIERENFVIRLINQHIVSQECIECKRFVLNKMLRRGSCDVVGCYGHRKQPCLHFKNM